MIFPAGGVVDNPTIDPTTIPDEALQEGVGEYRVGSPGFWSARGRQLRGDLGSATGRGLYYASYDGAHNFILTHTGDSYSYSEVTSGLSFISLGNHGSATLPIVGTHASNKHFACNGVSNHVIEFVSAATGLSTRPIGMTATGRAIGLSVTQGVSTFTVTTALTYWATEYDSARGIESPNGTTIAGTTFSLLDGVFLTLSGTTRNTNADQLRLYRTLDGGVFPYGGLLATLAISATTYYDQSFNTSTLPATRYGIVSIGLLDFNRDEPPPLLHAIGGPFQDSLLAFPTADRRTLLFTPAGYYESWPTIYGFPLETSLQDQGNAIVMLPNAIGAMCDDSIHAIYRIPRDADTVFAAGEYSEVVDADHGCVSRRGAVRFSHRGSHLIAYVSRDGLFATQLTDPSIPLTDVVDWDGRVDVDRLSDSVLEVDPLNRRLVFSYFKPADGVHRTGLMYLDYQADTIRISHPDHGSLADIDQVIDTDGKRRLFSIDERASNGQVYSETNVDADESDFVDSSGTVSFSMRTKEFMPGGADALVHIGNAHYMHTAGPAGLMHYFYHNRDSGPEPKGVAFGSRGMADVNLGRQVNSFSTRLVGGTTAAFAVQWMEFEGLDAGRKSGLGGA
jgi:hypothetical protein